MTADPSSAVTRLRRAVWITASAITAEHTDTAISMRAMKAEQVHGEGRGRRQGDDHRPHDLWYGFAGPYMGSGWNYQQVFFLFYPVLAWHHRGHVPASFFCRASLIKWLTGRRAGHT